MFTGSLHLVDSGDSLPKGIRVSQHRGRTRGPGDAKVQAQSKAELGPSTDKAFGAWVALGNLSLRLYLPSCDCSHWQTN